MKKSKLITGGIRNDNEDTFENLGSHGVWWSATKSGADGYFLNYDMFSINYYFGSNSSGWSVRCLKN